MSAHPRREAALQRVSIAGEGSLPSLAALFHKTVDIAGSGKRKIDGEYAATRLKQAMTSKWANERFRQVMLLVRQFRMEWPNQRKVTHAFPGPGRTSQEQSHGAGRSQRERWPLFSINPQRGHVQRYPRHRRRASTGPARGPEPGGEPLS